MCMKILNKINILLLIISCAAVNAGDNPVDIDLDLENTDAWPALDEAYPDNPVILQSPKIQSDEIGTKIKYSSLLSKLSVLKAQTNLAALYNLIYSDLAQHYLPSSQPAQKSQFTKPTSHDSTADDDFVIVEKPE